MVEDKIDYKKLGLKVGLEIHQQLNTRNKLFCLSHSAMQEKNPIDKVVRKQHPVASELGEIDVAAQYEYLRNRTFVYQIFPREVCLVETDEEPPRGINEEALRIALEIALLLNCQIPDEIHVMRKTVIDGSNTTSFQRTSIVGMNGYIKYKNKKVGIKHVALEEDAAALLSEENGIVTYKLNRLGIPLVEIATEVLENFSPEEIEELAFYLGIICRSTEKVRRGIGTIRQDVNISIREGERVEVKGVQELNTLAKVIKNEVLRQIALIDIKKELERRRVKKIPSTPIDVTNIIKGTRNSVLKSIIDNNGTIYALHLPRFGGLFKKELCPGKTLGKELAEIARAYGVGGLFHSDEDLTKNFLFEDFKKIREFLNAEIQDAIILIGEFKDKGKVAQKILERCNQLIKGVQKEVRAALEDSTTRYMRPLPGAARMYPETDVVPVIIKKEFLEEVRKQLPEPWTKKLSRFKKYDLPDQLARQIIDSDYCDLFEKIVKEKKVEATFVASFFTSTLKDLQKRENVKIEKISEEKFLEIFEFLSKKRIVKEAIPTIIKYLAENPESNLNTVIKNLKLQPIPNKILVKIVKEVVETPKINFDKALNIVMSKVRGKADAQDVIKLLKKYLKR